MKNISINFGSIRDSIIRLSKYELLKENKDDTLTKFTKSVKNNPILYKQFLVYKNFEDCKPFEKSVLAERFIQQNIKLFNGITWHNLISENKKLIKEFLEVTHVESSGGKKDELFNNVNTLIESVTNVNFKDSGKENNSYKYVLSYLTRPVVEEQYSNEKTDGPDFKNSDFIIKLAVNNFEKRYEHLNENEKKVLSILVSEGDKKRNYIEDLRKENLSLIENKIQKSSDDNSIGVLKEYKTKLENVDKINSLSQDDVVLEFTELNETLKEA